jgi:ABC-type dipeptide/oligopeptide/nickel transport system permease component
VLEISLITVHLSLVLGIVVFYAGFLMVLNLLVDVAYAWLDPRVELA